MLVSKILATSILSIYHLYPEVTAQSMSMNYNYVYKVILTYNYVLVLGIQVTKVQGACKA